MTDNSIETKNINISEFADDTWFKDRTKSSFWLRIYSSLGIPHEDFGKRVSDALIRTERNPPLKIMFGQMEGLDVQNDRIFMYVHENGSHTISFYADKYKLVKTNYVWFVTPYQIDGIPGKETDTKLYLNKIESLLVLHIGSNFLRDIVIDAVIDASDGKMSTASIIRMPQTCEGPFLNKQNGEDMSEIEQALRLSPTEIRNRIDLSLEFIEKGVRENNGFFNYWIALEILCNGKAPKIRSKLQQCYKLKNTKEAEELSGFKTIAKWRHSFVHEGIKTTLSSDVERYVQLMYLDLLRHELDLSPRFHTASMQRTSGVDLSPLGLRDNRTDEQKSH